jgi:multidrug efflux pump subunit AcrA (membrane-fusion protein)
LLRPGLYAYAAIIAAERTDALTVPTTAVVRDGGQPYVVVVADGQARRREIEVGLSDGQRVEVASGLEGDEAIVRADAEALADGQSVEAEPAEPAAGSARK